MDKKNQGIGFGSYLVETMKNFFVTDNRTGCRFLTVDAYNEDKKINFYRNNEFDFLTEKDRNKKTRTMYFDLLPILYDI